MMVFKCISSTNKHFLFVAHLGPKSRKMVGTDTKTLLGLTYVVLLLFWPCNTLLLHSSPLVWSESKKIKVANKLTESHFTINMVNSCDVMAALYHSELQEDALKACNRFYNDLVVKEIRDWCPARAVVKRFDPVTLFIGFLITTAIGLGAVSTFNSYSNSQQIHTIGEAQAANTKFSQAVEKQVLSQQQNIDNFTQNYNTLVEKLAAFSLDHQEFKNTFVDSVLGAGHLMSQFSLKQHQIRNTKRMWKQGIVSEEFLDIFNAKLSCGESCPIHLAQPIECRLKTENQLILKVLTPMENPDLAVMESFSFDFLVINNGMYCRQKYVGPSRYIMSRKGKCVVRSNYNDEEARLGFISLQTDYRCLKDFEPQHLFNLTECNNSSYANFESFVQVKYLNGNFYAYCPGLNISINGITKKCSESVMVLPYRTEFSINNQTFSINQNDAVFNETRDIELPLIADHVLSLTDNYNFSSLMYQSTEKITPISLRDFWYHPATIIGGTSVLGIAILGLIVLVGYKLIFKKKSQGPLYF